MLEIMRKTQYCCLEMLLLRNKVEKCDFLRFFLLQATAGKAIGGGLRARATAGKAIGSGLRRNSVF